MFLAQSFFNVGCFSCAVSSSGMDLISHSTTLWKTQPLSSVCRGLPFEHHLWIIWGFFCYLARVWIDLLDLKVLAHEDRSHAKRMSMWMRLCLEAVASCCRLQLYCASSLAEYHRARVSRQTSCYQLEMHRGPLPDVAVADQAWRSGFASTCCVWAGAIGQALLADRRCLSVMCGTGNGSTDCRTCTPPSRCCSARLVLRWATCAREYTSNVNHVIPSQTVTTRCKHRDATQASHTSRRLGVCRAFAPGVRRSDRFFLPHLFLLHCAAVNPSIE